MGLILPSLLEIDHAGLNVVKVRTCRKLRKPGPSELVFNTSWLQYKSMKQ